MTVTRAFPRQCYRTKNKTASGKKKSPLKKSSTYKRNHLFLPSPGPPLNPPLPSTTAAWGPPPDPSSLTSPLPSSATPSHFSLPFPAVGEALSTPFNSYPLPSSLSSPPRTPSPSHPGKSTSTNSSPTSPSHLDSCLPVSSSIRFPARPSTSQPVTSSTGVPSLLPQSCPLKGPSSPSEVFNVHNGYDEVDLPLPPPPSLTQQQDSSRVNTDEDEEWPEVPDVSISSSRFFLRDCVFLTFLDDTSVIVLSAILLFSLFS